MVTSTSASDESRSRDMYHLDPVRSVTDRRTDDIIIRVAEPTACNTIGSEAKGTFVPNMSNGPKLILVCRKANSVQVTIIVNPAICYLYFLLGHKTSPPFEIMLLGD